MFLCNFRVHILQPTRNPKVSPSVHLGHYCLGANGVSIAGRLSFLHDAGVTVDLTMDTDLEQVKAMTSSDLFFFLTEEHDVALEDARELEGKHFGNCF